MMNLHNRVLADQGSFYAYQARFMGFIRHAINLDPSGSIES